MFILSDRLVQPGRARHPSIVKAWRWRIAAAAEAVPLQWSLAVGVAVLDALNRTAWTLRGSGKLPVCLHGPDDPADSKWAHEHAFILPEDADFDGVIDHISVVASMGLDPAALRLLVAADRITLSNGAWLELTLERAGGLEAAGHCGPATEWISRTPYVPPNGRPRFDAKDAARQLKYEVGKRRLGAALVGPPKLDAFIEHARGRLAMGEFDMVSDLGNQPPSGAAPCCFRLTFDRPVSGPLAFGWACHKGLGQFVEAG